MGLTLRLGDDVTMRRFVSRVVFAFALITLIALSTPALAAPSISSLSPTTGAVGTLVTITGADFGATEGAVTFNDAIAVTLSWSPNSITALVPPEASTGDVVVHADGLNSNGSAFVVVSPLLKLRINDAPGIVNLSASHYTDWIVWGADGNTTAATRKAGAGRISDFTALGNATVYADVYGYVQFGWTGGDIIESAASTTPEIWISETDIGGFQIMAPADTTVQTLNIFLGIGKAVRLDAFFSDGSIAPISDSSVTSLSDSEKVYSIDFRAASPGQTLTVQIKLTDPTSFLTLHAATLEAHPPEVSVASPLEGQVFGPGTTSQWRSRPTNMILLSHR